MAVFANEEVAMNLNVGTVDRVIRVTIGIICAYLALAPTAALTNDVLRIFLGLFGAMNLITGLLGWCPMYAMANMSTRKN